MPGPMGFYIFKYHIKGTQEEDTEEYNHVKEGTQKALALSLESLGDSKHCEAMRRLLSTSFAHQKTNRSSNGIVLDLAQVLVHHVTQVSLVPLA
jgi:hypothetical protein